MDSKKAAAAGEAKSKLDGPPPVPADNAADSAIATPANRDADAVLGKVEMERKLSVMKAWEEREKSRAENKAAKKLSGITSWEKTRRAAKLRAREEEKMRNQAAAVHEKRAAVEAERHQAILRCQDMAADHRSKGTTPPKRTILGRCFL